MSHFSVLVKVDGSVIEIDLESAVGRILDPYCEHTDNGRLLEYFQFVDDEDEYLKKYETEGCDMIRLADGGLVYPWDERFRVPLTIGQGSGTHKPPPELERVEIPHKIRYRSFESFMADFCGYEARELRRGRYGVGEYSRYGHYANPNAKWDWWQIGGRWENEIPTRFSKVNYARICNIDFASVQRDTDTAIEKFKAEFDGFLSGRDFGPFDSPRSTLLTLGILTCVDEGELPKVPFWKQKWTRQNTPGVDRYDVIARKPDFDGADSAFLRNYLCSLRPYAYVDAEGWHEKGEMGWFGVSHGTPDSAATHAANFLPWLLRGKQSDWAVMVDCHI